MTASGMVETGLVTVSQGCIVAGPQTRWTGKTQHLLGEFTARAALFHRLDVQITPKIVQFKPEKNSELRLFYRICTH